MGGGKSYKIYYINAMESFLHNYKSGKLWNGIENNIVKKNTNLRVITVLGVGKENPFNS